MTLSSTLTTFFVLGWKRFSRSTYFRQRLVARIFAILMGLYFLGNLVFIGYFLDSVIKELYPEQNIPHLINRYVFHFFGILLLSRFFIQKLPTVQLSPYLHLPVKKSNLVLSYLLLYLLNGFNHIPMIIAIPYWAKIVLPEFGFAAGMFWLLGFALLALALNFFVLKIKMLLFHRPGVFLGLMALLAGSAWLEHTAGTMLIASASSWLFDGLLNGSPSSLCVPFLLFLWSAASAYFSLRRQLYGDHGAAPRRRNSSLFQLNFFDHSQTWRLLFALEFKQISRNKVLKVLWIMGLIYGVAGLALNVLTRDRLVFHSGMAFLFYIPLGSIFIFQYAVSAFSSEGKYFDGLLSRNIEFIEYIDAKLLLVSLWGIGFYILNLALFYWISPLLRGLLSALFIHLNGLLTFVGVYHALDNTKSIKINGSIWDTSAAQGKFSHILLRLLLMAYPVIVLFLINGEKLTLNDNGFLSFGLISVPGVLSLLMLPFWRKVLLKKFNAKKYRMAEGFRQK